MGMNSNQHLASTDPIIAQALANESQRQQNQMELIASENIVSKRVLEALGHQISNKTLEGYPGNRFHGGGQFVDIIESVAIDRARQLFGASYVNVQPHSGTQANQAVFFSLLRPGDKVLSLDLTAGGHLSHGARPNQSGRWFECHHYTVDRETGLMDYDAIAQQALQVRPSLLIAGGSAYPREIDFLRLAQIAHSVDATFLVDMAHVAGLVAADAYPSPLPHADIVTCTTTKTMRGPRGGLILSKSDKFAKKLQSAIFPGVQGSLHSNVLAAKAVCLGEALQPSFKTYGQQVVANGRTLAKTLMDKGIKVVSGGTDSHMVLLDLSPLGLLGREAEEVLAEACVTSNKNPVPFDAPKPDDWVGLRLGVAAATTRGLDKIAIGELATTIADLILARSQGSATPIMTSHKAVIRRICDQHPI